VYEGYSVVTTKGSFPMTKNDETLLASSSDRHLMQCVLMARDVQKQVRVGERCDHFK